MNTTTPKSYRDLIAWQKSMHLVTGIYRATAKFPRHETYGLTSQMRRSAVSIPSNISEGSYRESNDDFRRFLLIAFSSGAELETQIEITTRLGYGEEELIKTCRILLDDVMRLLNRLIRSFSQR